MNLGDTSTAHLFREGDWDSGQCLLCRRVWSSIRLDETHPVWSDFRTVKFVTEHPTYVWCTPDHPTIGLFETHLA